MILRIALACVLCTLLLFGRHELSGNEATDAFVPAMINGQGDDWTELGENDFRLMKCDPDTWV